MTSFAVHNLFSNPFDEMAERASQGTPFQTVVTVQPQSTPIAMERDSLFVAEQNDDAQQLEMGRSESPNHDGGGEENVWVGFFLWTIFLGLKREGFRAFLIV